MYDQMYWTLTYGHTVHYNPVSLRPEMKAYTIFIDGISKAFAATGVRVGWAFGPQNVLAKMRAINSHVGAWSPMAEQHATAAFLENDKAVDAYFVHYRQELELRLQKIYDGLQQLKRDGYNLEACAPQAAIYLTIRISLVGKKDERGQVLVTQADVTSYLLNEAGLAVVPFYAFGASRDSDWYRLSIGTCRKEDIPQMLRKLRTALEKLN
jgi:aspartate aminotransferase